MIRASLLALVAARTSESLGIVELIVDTVFDEIMAATVRGEPVKLDGFAQFSREHIRGRDGAPDYEAIRFRACHAWRKRLNTPQREAAE
jgi:nucleoid DNA-binding protein